MKGQRSLVKVESTMEMASNTKSPHDDDDDDDDDVDDEDENAARVHAERLAEIMRQQADLRHIEEARESARLDESCGAANETATPRCRGAGIIGTPQLWARRARRDRAAEDVEETESDMVVLQ